jgi:hypothetical protein
MKKVILFIACILTGNLATAQVAQTVSIGANYPDAVYYSMQNGAYAPVSNTNWDLGFQLRGFAASIIVNSKNNVQVYRANKAVSQWASMTATDTTGILNSTYELHNSDITWDLGALSGTYDTANAFDLGWGVYDFVTHAVTGDSIFYIKLATGDVKKLWIESLTTGIFYFRWADVDGSNEITAQLDKTNFPDKFFGYYSIVNNTWIDREPAAYNQWDLLFTQYMAITPLTYKVTGVLSNDSVFVEKAYPVDVMTASPSGNYSLNISEIGYNWKAYDFSTNTWTIEDSLVYFVKDRSAGIWKVIFTGFGGAANGNYDFTKEFLGVAGVDEQAMNPVLSLYPNPANDQINVVMAKQGEETWIRIVNAMGAVVRQQDAGLVSALQTVSVDVADLAPGIYMMNVIQEGKSFTRQFVIQ